MAIDMKVLFAATHGDQDKKVEVKRKWLTEVHKDLEAGYKAQRELAALRAQLAASKDMTDTKSGRKDPFAKFDEKMDRAFDGFDEKFEDVFSGLFGKRKK